MRLYVFGLKHKKLQFKFWCEYKYIEGRRLIEQIIISAVFTLLFSGAAIAQLTLEQQAAKDRGVALYKQSDWYDSQPLLRIV